MNQTKNVTWKFNKPRTYSEIKGMKDWLNCTWGVFKKFGWVQKRSIAIRPQDKKRKANKTKYPYGVWQIGEYIIGPARTSRIQPSGLKRERGKTVLQSFRKLQKRSKKWWGQKGE